MVPESKARKKQALPKRKAAAKAVSVSAAARRLRARLRSLTLDERLLALEAAAERVLAAVKAGDQKADKAVRAADKALAAAREGRKAAEANQKAAEANQKAAEAAERKAERKADRSLRLADKAVYAATEARKAAEATRKSMEAQRDRLDEEAAAWHGHRDNYARGLEKKFALGLPRAMRAHGIVIAPADVQTRVRLSPERLEYDIVAPNGEVVLVGEVKTRLRLGDVLEMVGRLKHFREDYPEYAGLKLHGVVAGWAVDASALAMAKKEGFFVLRLTGSDAEVHPALGEKFKPAAY